MLAEVALFEASDLCGHISLVVNVDKAGASSRYVISRDT